MTAKIAGWAYTPGIELHPILGARIVRAYRCSMEALFPDYMIQAATIPSSLYEIVLALVMG